MRRERPFESRNPRTSKGGNDPRSARGVAVTCGFRTGAAGGCRGWRVFSFRERGVVLMTKHSFAMTRPDVSPLRRFQSSDPRRADSWGLFILEQPLQWRTGREADWR